MKRERPFDAGRTVDIYVDDRITDSEPTVSKVGTELKLVIAQAIGEYRASSIHSGMRVQRAARYCYKASE